MFTYLKIYLALKKSTLMKIKLSAYILFIGGLFFLTSTYFKNRSNHITPTYDVAVSEVEEQNRPMMAYVLFNILQEYAYHNLKIDDRFSDNAYHSFLENVDYAKRYFTKADSAKLSSYRFNIDDEINNFLSNDKMDSQQFEFYNATMDILNSRIEDVKGFYPEILAESFDFNLNDSIYFDEDYIFYVKNKNELKDRWKLYLKYQTLVKLNELIEDQEKALEANDTSFVVTSFEEKELKSREKIKKRYDDYFKRVDKIKDEDRFEVYINSILSIYDPHTNFFAPKEKKDFDIRMSGKLEGIGAQLQEKDEQISVTRIIPGSPSAIQGELEVKDVIIKVAQGDSLPISIEGMSISDAVEYIRGKKGTEVRLTVLKPDGTKKVISIIRDVIEIGETYAKSSVITKNGKKIGYILLPSFYVDFSDANGRRCSTDVKKELEKLKKAGVEGIVFDLRNNGGGSLEDVIEMVGYFVEKGPIVQVKSRGAEPRVYNDYDSDVVYDGPLVVMINEYSASASEIFAAAIQDYHRGVIVGTKQSFGKGTVQRFIGLNDVLQNNDQNLELGSLKLTIQKFYRIDGRSTQLNGVQSDIVFPDLYSEIKVGEREQSFALPYDVINSSNYNDVNDVDSVVLASLLKQSNARVDTNSYFNVVKKGAIELKKQNDRKGSSLNLNDYQAALILNNEKNEAFDPFKNIEPLFEVNNLNEDLLIIQQSDSSKILRNKDWLKNSGKDFYINESVNVIEDLIDYVN